jgi:hypothetical protein
MMERTTQPNIVNNSPEPGNWSDAEISMRGLQEITAYIRTQESKEARRGRENRKKLEGDGVRQLNVQERVEVHPILKQIAKMTRDGESNILVHIQQALNGFPPQAPVKDNVVFNDLKGFRRDVYNLGVRITELQGWRRQALKLLKIL